MNKLAVAKLGRAVGLKGFVRFVDLSDFAKQFKKGARFYGKNDEIYTIKDVNKNNATLLFEGFESLELAKNLTNTILYKSIEQTRAENKLKKDEYFYFDILGSCVFENELLLGKISDIMQTSASYLLLVQTDEKLIQNGLSKEFYLPYADFYIQSVDIQNSRIFTQNALVLLKSLSS
ncbi:16S rRNA processing protein RimM [Campylobacter sp. MIT 99-7217]|uniref:ribosome maturation factor RimM n=1 Tax=Campylobacter sp. MIT 99-7217 TaxID=535091 RepID=UPI0011581792|nr:ribosome maturation factor RimM [Campylobacter sp. MIT 99-7217]TQR34502.1 16S rRNA processing protein RimM [Campylobacter sp. MIT 99-7217]